MKCKRCHNTKFFLFAKIYCEQCDKCYYCLRCAHISIFKLCDETLNDFIFTYEKVKYNLSYKLTSKQMRISSLICKNIKYNNIFINATCGAGKTEMIFEVVERYINNSLHVCFMSPRAEVIHEIYHRFNKAFNENFAIKTGKYKMYTGGMVFMTAHQLVNYHETFDLVIVDEADAFPLINDKVLEQGIVNSLRYNGRIIKMSATPLHIDKSFVEFKLEERYHKANIPIPYYEKLDDEKLQMIISSGKWLVFFPTIKCLEQFVERNSFNEVTICHSKIDYVIDHIDLEFSDYVIFSTAILERGVTFSNVNVIVYDATHDNFGLNTLVQITGRVGRVVPYVNGEVIFMCNKTNNNTRKCIKHISDLND